MHAYIKKSIIAIAGAALLSSCEIETEVKLKDGDPRLVIECWLTDQPEPQLVRITRSTPFTGQAQDDYVSGARVILSDENGLADTLAEIRPGQYVTSTFHGQQQTNYTLTVTVDGKTYTAQNYLPRVNPILALGYEFNDSLFFGPGYYVGGVAPEPAGIGDYYQFRISRNDSLFNSPFDLFITDDRLVDGQISPFLFPYPHEIGDTIGVEIRAISNLSYDFFITYSQQTSGGGGPFGSPPENLLTNWDNGALGFFGCAAVTRDTIVIQ